MYVPKIQVYLFRKKYKDLRNNHLWGPEGFVELLKDYVKAGLVTINYSDMRINFLQTGGQIHLSHMNNEADMYNYQGRVLPLVA